MSRTYGNLALVEHDLPFEIATATAPPASGPGAAAVPDITRKALEDILEVIELAGPVNVNDAVAAIADEALALCESLELSG